LPISPRRWSASARSVSDATSLVRYAGSAAAPARAPSPPMTVIRAASGSAPALTRRAKSRAWESRRASRAVGGRDEDDAARGAVAPGRRWWGGGGGGRERNGDDRPGRPLCEPRHAPHLPVSDSPSTFFSAWSASTRTLSSPADADSTTRARRLREHRATTVGPVRRAATVGRGDGRPRPFVVIAPEIAIRGDASVVSAGLIVSWSPVGEYFVPSGWRRRSRRRSREGAGCDGGHRENGTSPHVPAPGPSRGAAGGVGADGETMSLPRNLLRGAPIFGEENYVGESDGDAGGDAACQAPRGSATTAGPRRLRSPPNQPLGPPQPLPGRPSPASPPRPVASTWAASPRPSRRGSSPPPSASPTGARFKSSGTT